MLVLVPFEHILHVEELATAVLFAVAARALLENDVLEKWQHRRSAPMAATDADRTVRRLR